MPFPRVWDLLDRFKLQCQLGGWKTSRHEDWVRTDDGKYHNFLWAQTVHQSTFKKVVKNHKCAIREGVSYQVVDISYSAWLFPRSSPENLIQTVRESIELSRRTAIYDLSHVYTDKLLCLKLNETDSMVFRRFEKFLEDELGVEVRPAHSAPTFKT